MQVFAYLAGACHTQEAMAPMPGCLATMCAKKKVIGLEEAIRRMTSLPAQRFGLKDRGLLREGMVADLVIFDEKLVEDASTFEKPHQYSKGFSWVIVNGALTLAAGQHTGARQGEVLYRSEE